MIGLKFGKEPSVIAGRLGHEFVSSLESVSRSSRPLIESLRDIKSVSLLFVKARITNPSTSLFGTDVSV